LATTPVLVSFAETAELRTNVPLKYLVPVPAVQLPDLASERSSSGIAVHDSVVHEDTELMESRTRTAKQYV
jgi:hypothetical protein